MIPNDFDRLAELTVDVESFLNRFDVFVSQPEKPETAAFIEQMEATYKLLVQVMAFRYRTEEFSSFETCSQFRDELTGRFMLMSKAIEDELDEAEGKGLSFAQTAVSVLITD